MHLVSGESKKEITTNDKESRTSEFGRLYAFFLKPWSLCFTILLFVAIFNITYHMSYKFKAGFISSNDALCTMTIKFQIPYKVV